MINTYFPQELMPDRIVSDSRGTLIEEGLRVAYNYQGLIKLGKILSYTSSWKSSRTWKTDYGYDSWWSCKFSIKILNEEGIISTVKNPNSFIII